MGEGQKTEMLDVSKLTGDGVDVTFVVMVPGQVEKRYPMRAASMRVGRSDQSDIAIKDASVSSRHCDLVKENGRLLVRDLGSSNGTFLNDQRTQEGELSDGDVLRLGNAATVTVSVQGAGAPRSAMPAGDGSGSTAMISADQLDAMRRPAPRRPSSPMMPPPRAASQASGGPSNGLIVGIAVGIAVVIVVGVIGGVMFMRSRAHERDALAISQIASQVKAITQTSPCQAVQDSVASLTQIGAGIATPRFPVRRGARGEYEKFVEAQREKVRQYKHIAERVESDYEPSAQAQIGVVKQEIDRLGDETLKAKAKDLAQSLDDRMNLAQDYDGGWKKLAAETDHYADIAEQVFIKGTGNAGAYLNFHFSRVPPILHRSCRQNHDTNGRDIDEKVAALQQLVAK